MPAESEDDSSILTCQTCQKPMVLLLQIYAPLTEEDCETLADPESSFHRILYVFSCKNGLCHQPTTTQETQTSSDNKVEVVPSKVVNGVSKAFVVIRAQLPEENDFYKFSENDDKWILEENKKVKKSNTCEICGLFASKRCSACTSVHYCCKDHQLLDWNLGHDKQCKIIKNNNANNTKQKVPEKRQSHTCFDEFELTTDLEIFTKQQHETILREEIKEEREKAKSTLVTNLDPEEQFERVEKDATFLRFQTKISSFKDQVLRYYNSLNRTKKSLIVSKEGLITDFPNMPPPCELCGSPRQLEFQVCFF